jgi:hypothetical protein
MNVKKGIVYTTAAGLLSASVAQASPQEVPVFKVKKAKTEASAEAETITAPVDKTAEKTAPKSTFSLDDLRNMASSGIDSAQKLYGIAEREYEHRANLTMYVDPIFGLSVIDATTCKIDRMGDQDLARDMVNNGLLSYTSELVAMDECKADARKARRAKRSKRSKRSRAKVAPVDCSVHVENMDLDATIDALAGEGAKVVRFAEGDNYQTIMDNVSAFYQVFSSDAKAKDYFGKGPKVLGQNILEALTKAYSAFGEDGQPKDAAQTKTFHEALKVVYEDMGNFMRYHEGAVVLATAAENKVGYDASKTSDHRKIASVEDLVTGKAALVAFGGDNDVYNKFCWAMDKAAEKVEATVSTEKTSGTDKGNTATVDNVEKKVVDTRETPKGPFVPKSSNEKAPEKTEERNTDVSTVEAPTIITTNKGYSSNGTVGMAYMRMVAMGAADGNIVMPYLEGRVAGGLELGVGIPILMRNSKSYDTLEGSTIPNADSPSQATTSSYDVTRIGDGFAAGAFDGIGLQARASYKLGRVVDIGVGVMAVYEEMQRYSLTDLALSDGTPLDSERVNGNDVDAIYLMPTGRVEFHLFPKSTSGNMGIVLEGGPVIPFNIPNAVMDQLNIPNVGGVVGSALQYTWGATQETTTTQTRK